MTELRFSDGVSVETGGEYRIVRKRDGLYVVGHGMLCPVSDCLEGQELIADLLRIDKETK